MVRARKRYKVLVLFDTAGTPPPDQDFSKELKTEAKETGKHLATLAVAGYTLQLAVNDKVRDEIMQYILNLVKGNTSENVARSGSGEKTHP